MKLPLFLALLFTVGMTSPAHAQCRIGSGPDFGDGIPYCSELEPDVPQPPPYPESDEVPNRLPPLWGAIAIDPKSVTGGVGVSTGVPSRQIAELMALRQCRENGGRTCGVEISYSDQCAALAWGDHYHFVASAQTLSEASDTALRGCASETAKCKIVYSNCT